MRAGVGLVLAVGTALVVDPVVRAVAWARDSLSRAGSAGASFIADTRDAACELSLRRPSSSDPLLPRVLGALAVTIVCIAIGAAISRT